MVGQKKEEIRQTVEVSEWKDRDIQRREFKRSFRQMEADMGWKVQTIQWKEGGFSSPRMHAESSL